MIIAPSGVRIMSAVAPTDTPPARVAFWMCSMQNLLWEFIESNQSVCGLTSK